MPRRRTGTAYSSRSVRRSMRDASENSTTVSVASASSFTDSPVGDVSTRSSALVPTIRPIPTKMIAGVIGVPSIRREMAPKPISATATTARAHPIVTVAHFEDRRVRHGDDRERDACRQRPHIRKRERRRAEDHGLQPEPHRPRDLHRRFRRDEPSPDDGDDHRQADAEDDLGERRAADVDAPPADRAEGCQLEQEADAEVDRAEHQPRRASSSCSSATAASSRRTRSSSDGSPSDGGSARAGGSSSLAAEELAVAILLLPGASRDPHRELAFGECRERLLDLVRRRKRMHPLGTRLQLGERLRAAQHHHREHRQLRVVHAERVLHEMAVLDRAARRTARESHPAAVGQLRQRGADRRLVVLDDRLAVRRLVAGEPQRVQRQGICVGRRPPLLDEAAEHPDLHRICVHGAGAYAF